MDADREERLAAVIAELRDRLNAGEPVERERFLAEHPDFRVEINAYFSFERFVEEALGSGPRAPVATPPDPLRAFDLHAFPVRRRLDAQAPGPVFLLHGEGETERSLLVATELRGRPELEERFREALRFLAERRTPGALGPIESGRRGDASWGVFEHRDGTSLDAMTRRTLRGGRFGDGTAAAPDEPDGELDHASRRRRAAALARNALHLARVLAAFHAWARILDRAHAAGVLHGAVTPRFLCRDARGRFFVAGFGMGVLVSGQQAGESPHFDKRWLAPEVVRRRLPLGIRCDVYGLGLVLAATLALELPRPEIDGDGAVEMTRAGVPVEIEPPARAPRRLRALLARCTAVDPLDRPATLAAVARELGRLRWRVLLTSRWLVAPAVVIALLAAALALDAL